MFLPTLLMRDYGSAAWFIFAIPNVIGAAAMGWVLKSPESSARLVAQHREACLVFSYVTLSFHLYFIFWIARDYLPYLAGPTIVALIVFVMLGRLGRVNVNALLALVTSSVVIALWLYWGQRMPQYQVRSDTLSLTGLASVCTLGFLTCPYLDLTFHHARQSLGRRESRWAFSIGFGVFFLAMIVFTALYAPFFAGATFSDQNHDLLRKTLTLHIGVQIALTIYLHFRQAVVLQGTSRGWLMFIVLPVVGTALVKYGDTYNHFSAAELVYRLFMSCYGLIFPAYVWLCMLPRRDGSRPTRRDLLVLATVVILVSPLYWIAFIEGKMAWMLPAVAGVLVARLFIRPVSTPAP